MDYVVQADGTSLEFERHTLIKLLSNSPYKYTATVDTKRAEELTSDSVKGKIPIGTLQFVRKSLLLQGYNDNILCPIEIPYFLQTPYYLKRNYKIVDYNHLPTEGIYFIKDATNLKSSNARVINIASINQWAQEYSTLAEVKTHNFVVSEPMDIESEYRVLVCRGSVLAVQYYNGNPLVFPDAELIQNVVNAMSQHQLMGELIPLSYTIDIGVNKKVGTFVIEIHNFVSCGTYNFESNILPQMYIDGVEYERSCSNKSNFSYLYNVIV